MVTGCWDSGGMQVLGRFRNFSAVGSGLCGTYEGRSTPSKIYAVLPSSVLLFAWRKAAFFH